MVSVAVWATTSSVVHWASLERGTGRSFSSVNSIQVPVASSIGATQYESLLQAIIRGPSSPKVMTSVGTLPRAIGVPARVQTRYSCRSLCRYSLPSVLIATMRSPAARISQSLVG